ncbi:hypothetical protein HYFRA_00001395 [Hymenoscyphus fraxineus]|uniref:Uncharacterized protein n=1 Tax=Hymenoscyphus fraxineus TaxID=746836 RepID=A0A9N9PTT5_9HELO|nr:hypothetical protein HYFRA_00001395 [Hymenoscyphus fraxineus]
MPRNTTTIANIPNFINLVDACILPPFPPSVEEDANTLLHTNLLAALTAGLFRGGAFAAIPPTTSLEGLLSTLHLSPSPLLTAADKRTLGEMVIAVGVQGTPGTTQLAARAALGMILNEDARARGAPLVDLLAGTPDYSAEFVWSEQLGEFVVVPGGTVAVSNRRRVTVWLINHSLDFPSSQPF